MQRLVLACVLAGGLCGAPVLFGDEPGPTPAPAAVTQEQILTWVGELGSDDFRKREEADRQLAAAGEAAREALQSATKTSDSLEVRWRAQQLLLRLDGRKDKALGSPEESQGPGAAPGQLPDELRKLMGADTPEAVREELDRLMKEFLQGGTGPRFRVAPLRGFDAFATRLASGDLALKISTMGPQKAELEVRGVDASGAPTRTTYSGTSLEAILEANPALKAHPSLPGLRQELENAKRHGSLRLLDPGLRVPMFSFSSSEGIEIVQDGSGVTVRLREKGPDGKLETKEYKGESLDAIREANPHLADRLRPFQPRIAPPRIFRGLREEPLPPLPPQVVAPEVLPPVDAPRFGVLLEPVEALLARHLRLEDGHGALVREVAPGSIAATLGLEVYDILESIDGRPVTSMVDAATRLRAAAKANAPLSLGIIRSGQRQTLTR